MKNIVGQVPRGENFFPRDAIINKIYRRLESGQNLVMAAPRRVGKTSIMLAMQDNPREGFQFVYVITESVQDIEAYYHKLLTTTLNSSAMTDLAKKVSGVKTLIKEIAGSISIKLPGFEVELNRDQGKESSQVAFEKLLNKLDTGEDSIIIMIDEFPQTVENIREKHGAAAAETFLRINREQRQTNNSRIRFILTGSIGLPAVVKKLTSTSVINDLNVVEIPPLDEAEASSLATILLDTQHVQYDATVVPYLLQKIKWLIPFHVQLGVQELIDIYENNNQQLQQKDVDQAFQQLLNLRNNSYFEHYYIRLKHAFPVEQYHFALRLLNAAAQANTLSQAKVQALSKEMLPEKDAESVIESLTYDGYIFFDVDRKAYRFQSSLLQAWWSKKFPEL